MLRDGSPTRRTRRRYRPTSRLMYYTHIPLYQSRQDPGLRYSGCSVRSFRRYASVLASVFVAAAVAVIDDGCTPASMTAAPMSASTTAASRPALHATSRSTSSPVVDGELKIAADVVFEVRPLSGPGTMGPTVLSAKSGAALEEVRAYLAAHPDAGPLHIECAINPRRMSSSPDAKWPARLALQVARWLVEHEIDCKRLEAVGWLDMELDSPAERLRFFIDPKGRERPADQQTRLDVCTSLE
jgi:hypothetical protein